MTQPPGPQPPPGDQGNPWQLPPSPYPPSEPAPTGPFEPPPYQPPVYQPPPPYQPPAYQPAPPQYPPSSAPPAYPGAPPSYPGSAPPANVPTSGFPTGGFPQPGPPATGPVPYPGSAPPYPGSAPPYPGSAPPGSFPPYYGPPTPPPRRRGLLITVIVLVVLVVLGAGGLAAFYAMSRSNDGTGKTSATAAAEAFLQAVYTAQDAKQAALLVCSAARDTKKLQAKVNEIKQQDRQYDSPKYTWSTLTTESSGKDRAVLSTTVTLTTANVQKAAQKLSLTLIKSNGWFVCDVKQS